MSELPIINPSKPYSTLHKKIDNNITPRNNKNLIESRSIIPNKYDMDENVNFSLKLESISSSSSISWSDEYENEITKKIYEKLKVIDNVLKGREEFSPTYDKEELKQWMQVFPNVSIFDEPSPTRIKDVLLRNSKINNINHIYGKESVINNSEFAYSKLLSQRSASNRKRLIDDYNSKYKQIFTLSNKPRSLDLDRSYKVKPLKKFMDKNVSNPPKMDQFSTEFDSLPFIEIDDYKKPSSCVRSKKILNSSSTIRRKRDLLILPPINGDKLRSISATPSQDTTSKLFLI